MAKICKISGVPRSTRMHTRVGTDTILSLHMRISATITPSGSEKISV